MRFASGVFSVVVLGFLTFTGVGVNEAFGSVAEKGQKTQADNGWQSVTAAAPRSATLHADNGWQS